MRTAKVMCVVAAGIMIVLAGSPDVPLYAQDTKSISRQEACNIMKTLLPLQKRVIGWGFHGLLGIKITGTHLTSAGFTLSLGKKPDISIAYAEVKLDGITDYVDVLAFHTPRYSYGLFGLESTKAIRDQLFVALGQLAEAAHAGRPCDCTGSVVDSKAELDTFAQKTAAWRAMATKPVLSDDVIKKRLLAEDAIEHKNLRAAVGYYDAGAELDPTWAQGWYNAALLYAEQQDYFDAAVRMKHYLILLPDASDAATAKEKLLLWEAKAEEAGSN